MTGIKKSSLLAIALLTTLFNYATIYHVEPIAAGSGNGSGWTNAMTLSNALNIAGSGDEVWLASGMYTPTGSASNRFFAIYTQGIQLYGGFSGSETLRSQRNRENAPSILSGDNNTVLKLDYYLSGNDQTVIDGFTIQNGSIFNNTNGYGIEIGLYINPTIKNCNIINNSGGGVLINDYSAPVFINCTISGNESEMNGKGAGVWTKGNATFINCLFSGNRAWGDGGGIYANKIDEPINLTIINCTLSGNLANTEGANRGGGAIYYDNVNLKLYNSILWENGAGYISGSEDYSNVNNLFRGFLGSNTEDIQNSLTMSYEGEPLFVNAPAYNTAPFSGGNYQVQAGSPAINGGNGSFFPTDISLASDLAGMTRVGGGGIDMGPYESDGIALPAVFGTIQATINHQTLRVNWQTLKETQVQEYTIEGSADGVVFKPLKTIPSLAANGNSDQVLHYSTEISLTDAASALGVSQITLLLAFGLRRYRRRSRLLLAMILTLAAMVTFFSCSRQAGDLELNTGDLYIRIAQKDKDGSHQYSKVIKVNHP